MYQRGYYHHPANTLRTFAGTAEEATEMTRWTRISLGALALLASFAAMSGGDAPQADATFPGANGKIAFERRVNNAYEIWVMDSEGEHETNITNNPGND